MYFQFHESWAFFGPLHFLRVSVASAFCSFSNKSLVRATNHPHFPPTSTPPPPTPPIPPWQTTHGNHPLSPCFGGRLHFASREPDDKRPHRAARAAMHKVGSRWGGEEVGEGAGLTCLHLSKVTFWGSGAWFTIYIRLNKQWDRGASAKQSRTI